MFEPVFALMALILGAILALFLIHELLNDGGFYLDARPVREKAGPMACATLIFITCWLVYSGYVLIGRI